MTYVSNFIYELLDNIPNAIRQVEINISKLINPPKLQPVRYNDRFMVINQDTSNDISQLLNQPMLFSNYDNWEKYRSDLNNGNAGTRAQTAIEILRNYIDRDNMIADLVRDALLILNQSIDGDWVYQARKFLEGPGPQRIADHYQGKSRSSTPQSASESDIEAGSEYKQLKLF